MFHRQQTACIAVLSILVGNWKSVDSLNTLLHAYSRYIIGRMGIPYPKENVNIISIAMDAPREKISALSEKIKNLKGVTVTAAYAENFAD